MRVLKSCAWFAVMCASVVPLFAQAKTQTADRNACAQFVEKFYDWYVQRAVDIHADALGLALKDKRSFFSDPLVRGLEESRAESERNREAGLDFDPILNSQDPYDRYVVGKVTCSGQVCRVPIHGVVAGRKRDHPDVIAEVERHKGRWLFVNFHYPNSRSPDDENLARILAKAGGPRKH